MFPQTIQTDSLRLECLNQESVDVHDLYVICSSDPGIEEITEYLSWNPHKTVKETVRFLNRVDREWQNGENATYVIHPRDIEEGAGEIAGLTSLTLDWEQRTGTFGIWLRKRFWGRGYSRERADAFFELAFDRLDLEVVVIFHHDGNERSRRSIMKYVDEYGGHHEGLLRNSLTDGNGIPADGHRYTVSQSEYHASQEDS